MYRNKLAVTTGHEFSKELASLLPPLTASLRATTPLTRQRWQKEIWDSTLPLVPGTTHISKHACHRPGEHNRNSIASKRHSVPD